MDTSESSVYREQEGDPHPHACYEGIVHLTYTAFDESVGEEVGEEVEKIEAIPCRRCAEKSVEGREFVPHYNLAQID